MVAFGTPSSKKNSGRKGMDGACGTAGERARSARGGRRGGDENEPSRAMGTIRLDVVCTAHGRKAFFRGRKMC